MKMLGVKTLSPPRMLFLPGFEGFPPEMSTARRRLSTTFRSLKIQRTSDAKQPSKSLRFPSSTLLPSSSCSTTTEEKSELSSARMWCVYLILSTSVPLKTYVGVTNDFPRRLRQHNGELNGGAKASRAGRPWVCACIIHGFNDQSEACEFESRWKIFSRKTPSRRSHDDIQEQAEDGSLPLLRRRNAALDKVKGVFDCSHLVIDWKRSFS